ncbi:MAG: leucine-rich repeat domain-containing protein [Clostridia bacterium]|nr:leucine-rich repeat domain-containing protein [Clostridia bacterium]
MKKILAGILCVVLLCAVLPLGAFSVSAADGTCGKNVSWELDFAAKKLTISGTGAMTDYGEGEFSPWYTLTSYYNTVVIEEGVTTVGRRAFYSCNNITSVKIANSVTKIGDYAFTRCTALNGIALPNSVISIGCNAFEYCEKLRTVTFGKNLKTIGEKAFRLCTVLSAVTLPNGLTTIESNAFAGCAALKKAVLPDSLTAIDDYAFWSVNSAFTIACHAGTAAEKYAISRSIPYTLLHTAADLVRIKMVIMYGIAAPTYDENGDGVMDVRDLVTLKKQLA